MLGVLSFHSDWPPLSWKRTHFASSDIGQRILAISGLFLIFSLVYFFFPRIFRRRMSDVFGRLHFRANVIAVFLQFAIPVFFNLTFHAPSGQSKLGKLVQAFGTGLNSFAWEIGALALAQVFFLVNLLWSIFKGEKLFTSATTSAISVIGEI
jgi:heme/copper-type cytochrome/quinol oxidase subunit 1